MTEEALRDQIDAETSEILTDPETLIEHYERLRLLVDVMQSDVLKSQKGNKAAGTRLRKGLRQVKKFSGDFVKLSLGK
tara:strand:+ start:3557 stop:3790 length:234 start_codon:yes stop_codon:yes gene_type:complete